MTSYKFTKIHATWTGAGGSIELHSFVDRTFMSTHFDPPSAPDDHLRDGITAQRLRPLVRGNRRENTPAVETRGVLGDRADVLRDHFCAERRRHDRVGGR